MGGKHAFHAAADNLFVIALQCQSLIFARKIREIFRPANQEGKSLWRSRASKVIAELVALAPPLFHIDQHQVVHGGFPPYAGFDDVSGTINVDAELSQDFGT